MTLAISKRAGKKDEAEIGPPQNTLLSSLCIPSLLPFLMFLNSELSSQSFLLAINVFRNNYVFIPHLENISKIRSTSVVVNPIITTL